MRRQCLVIGMGEVGKALFNILEKTYGDADIQSFDILDNSSNNNEYDILNICFRYSDNFKQQVKDYIHRFKPNLVIIHSTVPIGTTKDIDSMCIHSPVLGDHTNMERSLLLFKKWIGGNLAEVGQLFLEHAGFRCRTVSSSNETEMLKLLCLAKYGVHVAMSKYEQDIVDKFDLSMGNVDEWDLDYNKGITELGRPQLQRPIFKHKNGFIGGHCVMPGTKMLNDMFPNQLLDEVIKRCVGLSDNDSRVIWQPCNIYPTAKIGKDVSIGAFTEIGHNVFIGDGVRIGAMCFIPEGITIEDFAWIGPKVTFSNDKFPPSGKDKWQKTIVHKKARIGASVNVLPGVEIGEGALIGMGSLITHDIPPFEKWCGVPARKMFDNSQDNCIGKGVI